MDLDYFTSKKFLSSWKDFSYYWDSYAFLNDYEPSKSWAYRNIAGSFPSEQFPDSKDFNIN